MFRARFPLNRVGLLARQVQTESKITASPHRIIICSKDCQASIRMRERTERSSP